MIKDEGEDDIKKTVEARCENHGHIGKTGWECGYTFPQREYFRCNKLFGPGLPGQNSGIRMYSHA